MLRNGVSFYCYLYYLYNTNNNTLPFEQIKLRRKSLNNCSLKYITDRQTRYIKTQIKGSRNDFLLISFDIDGYYFSTRNIIRQTNILT